MFIIDKKNNSHWNVSFQTNDFVMTYKIDTGAKTYVILKQSLACLPKSAEIKPRTVKLSVYICSSIPVIGSRIFSISTKHEMHSCNL